LLQAKEAAERKLRNLIAAVEDGVQTPAVLRAIREREAEIVSLARQLAAAEEPLDNRLTVIPTWVRQQLEDAAGLLADSPTRAKAEFQRFGIKFTLHPVRNEGPRAFLRAIGEGDFERLAFREVSDFPTTDRLHLR
jgi:hypothetical protein